MKILPTQQVAGIEQYNKISKKTNVNMSQPINQRDEIVFSNDATLFADALKSARQSLNDRLVNSNIDIAEIRSSIASGTYEVDNNELADSIMMLQGYYERG